MSSGAPQSGKCQHGLCKTCCRDKCHKEDVTCEGHRLRPKPLQELQEPPVNAQPVAAA